MFVQIRYISEAKPKMHNGYNVAVKMPINGSFTLKYMDCLQYNQFNGPSNAFYHIPLYVTPAYKNPNLHNAQLYQLYNCFHSVTWKRGIGKRLHLNATGHYNSAPSHRAQDRIHSASLTHIG